MALGGLFLYSEDPKNGPSNNGIIPITNFYYSVIQITVHKDVIHSEKTSNVNIVHITICNVP